jgi:aminoglycoside 3-N-acetyltransferase
MAVRAGARRFGRPAVTDEPGTTIQRPGDRQGQVVDRASLARDLRSLGVTPGQILLVHASLRRIGRVSGGPQDVVDALRRVLGRDATLVVPASTADNSDTSRLYLARTKGMSPDEIRRYRDAMPPFTAERPSVGMGRIAECVRTAPGAVRSQHPQTSFAALGPQARMLMTGHRLDCHLGESSPLGRLYQAGAWVLLMGVGYEACTCFHLAEYRYVSRPPRQVYRCVIAEQGQRRWWSYEDVVLDDRDFAALGAAFDQTGHVVRGYVGTAECRLIPLAVAVDFATEWLRRHRSPAHAGSGVISAKWPARVPSR